MVPQVVETWYRPGAASEPTVAVPARCHGWWPSGLPFSAPMSSTGERTAPRLSRHATSSDTAEPGAPCSGDTRNQLTPGADVGSPEGNTVGSPEGNPEGNSEGTALRLGDAPGSLGLEQAAVSTPRLTMLAIAKKARTPMPAQYAVHSPTYSSIHVTVHGGA
jgi:hypothetical protein